MQRHFDHHRRTTLKDETAAVLGPDGLPIVREVDDPKSWGGKGKLEVIRRHVIVEFFRMYVYHIDMFADPRLPHYRPTIRELGVEIHTQDGRTKLVRVPDAVDGDWRRLVGERPWSAEKYQSEAALLAEARMVSGRTRLVLEGVHAAWELAVLQANHQRIDPGPIAAVVAALNHLLDRMSREDAGEEVGGWVGGEDSLRTRPMIAVACSAAWALSPSAVPRRALIKVGAVEALHAALAAASDAAAALVAAAKASAKADAEAVSRQKTKSEPKPKTAAQLEEDRRRDNDRDVMQARAAGALSVMAIDPLARRRMFDLDPTLKAFLRPVHDHYEDPKPRLTKRQRRAEEEKQAAAAAAERKKKAEELARSSSRAGFTPPPPLTEEEQAAAAARAAAEEEKAAMDAELAALQAEMEATKAKAEAQALKAEKTLRLAATAKEGGDVFMNPHPIMDSIDTWRAVKAVVLSETIGTILTRDVPGRIVFIKAGGVTPLMDTLARATDNRVIIALTSVLAAFADDPEALKAIAETGDGAAMFKGMVPPLAAAIGRLEAAGAAETALESAGGKGWTKRERRAHEEELTVARRMAETTARALWGGARAVVLQGEEAMSSLNQTDIDNLLEIIIDTIALPPRIVFPLTVTNVLGALAALARDNLGAAILVRSFDLLSPLLHAALAPPGHGVRARSIATAVVGGLCDHDHRSTDACMTGVHRDLIDDDGLFRTVQVSCLHPTALAQELPLGGDGEVLGSTYERFYSAEAAADLVEAGAATMCLMSMHARERAPEELDAVLVLIESHPARRCGVVKLLCGTIWGMMRNDTNRAVMLGMTRMQANVLGPGQVGQGGEVGSAPTFKPQKDREMLGEDDNSSTMNVGQAAAEVNDRGTAAPADGKTGTVDDNEVATESSVPGMSFTTLALIGTLGQHAPRFVGDRCLSILIRVGHRLVARDFTDLGDEEGPTHVVGPSDAETLANLVGPSAATAIADLETKPGNTSWRRPDSSYPSTDTGSPGSLTGSDRGSRRQARCSTLESGAKESQSQIAHALCFWQAAIWLVLYDERVEATHTTPEGVFARVGDSWWMVPPLRPNPDGKIEKTYYGPPRTLDTTANPELNWGEDNEVPDAGVKNGDNPKHEATTRDPTQVRSPGPRAPWTKEVLGLLLAVLATPPTRAGDVPGYVRAGGMGLLWNLSARDVTLERLVCEGGYAALAATAQASLMPPFARSRAAQLLQALAESAGAEHLGSGGWAALEASLVSLVTTGVPHLELTGAKGLIRRTHSTNGGAAGRESALRRGGVAAALQLLPMPPAPEADHPVPGSPGGGAAAGEEGQAAALRLLLNFSAHDRAQVALVQLGLDRVLWANWSPRASDEIRSLSSMVLHNVRGNPANTTALYKAELRAKRACALVYGPKYAVEPGWVPPVNPVTGSPGPGIFYVDNDQRASDVESEDDQGEHGGSDLRGDEDAEANGKDAKKKRVKSKGPTGAAKKKGAKTTKGVKRVVKDSTYEEVKSVDPRQASSSGDRRGKVSSSTPIGRPTPPSNLNVASRTGQKFLKWEGKAFDGITTRPEKMAARQAARQARATPGYVDRLAATDIELKGAAAASRPRTYFPGTYTTGPVTGPHIGPEGNWDAGEGADSGTDGGRKGDHRSLSGLQSKMRGSPASVLAPITHDTPGPAVGAQRWAPAVTEYHLNPGPPPKPEPSARERIGMKKMNLKGGSGNPVKLPQRPATAMFKRFTQGRSDADLYARAHEIMAEYEEEARAVKATGRAALRKSTSRDGARSASSARPGNRAGARFGGSQGEGFVHDENRGEAPGGWGNVEWAEGSFPWVAKDWGDTWDQSEEEVEDLGYDYAVHEEPEEERLIPHPLLSARMPAVLTADLLAASENLAVARGSDQLNIDAGPAPRPPQAYTVDTGMFPLPRNTGTPAPGARRGHSGVGSGDPSFVSSYAGGEGEGGETGITRSGMGTPESEPEGGARDGVEPWERQSLGRRPSTSGGAPGYTPNAGIRDGTHSMKGGTPGRFKELRTSGRLPSRGSVAGGRQSRPATAIAAANAALRREGTSPSLPSHVKRSLATRTPPNLSLSTHRTRSSHSATGKPYSAGDSDLGGSRRKPRPSSHGTGSHSPPGGRRTPVPTRSTARMGSSECVFPAPSPHRTTPATAGRSAHTATRGSTSGLFTGGAGATYGGDLSYPSIRVSQSALQRSQAIEASKVGPALTVIPKREKLIAAGCDPSGAVSPPPDPVNPEFDPDLPRLDPPTVDEDYVPGVSAAPSEDNKELWRKPMPLSVVVGGATRRPLRFGKEHIPIEAEGRARALVFEHVQGSRVLEGVMTVYRLPNGRQAYYYDKGSSVYEETHLDILTPPGQPRLLSDLFIDQLPIRSILDRLSTPEDDGEGANGFAPSPPTCPLPGLHSLRVKHPRKVDEPTAYGDLVPVNIRFMVRFEKVLVESEYNEDRITHTKEPWSIHKSVYVPRKKKESDAKDFWDNPEVAAQVALFDWNETYKKQKFVKFLGMEHRKNKSKDAPTLEAMTARILAALQKSYMELETAFRYFSSAGSGNMVTMQLNEFSELMTVCDVPENDTATCRRADLDTIFITTNFDETQDRNNQNSGMLDSAGANKGPRDHNNDVNSIVRSEYVELLVRLAAAKHVSLGRTQDLAEAVEMFCEETIISNLPDFIREDRGVWRNSRLYTEGMDDVWKRYLEFVKLLHKVYRKKGGGHLTPSMSIEQLERMCEQLELYDGTCTIQKVRNAFLFSQMLVVNNIDEAWKAEGLQFVEFLEALARIAELWNLPSQGEIAKGDTFDPLDLPDIVEYLEIVRVDSQRAVHVPPAHERPPEDGLEAFLDMLARKIFNRSTNVPEGEEFNLPRTLKIMTAALTRVM